MDVKVKIDIYDIIGNKVKTVSNILSNKGKNTITVDVNNLYNGMYFATIVSNNGLKETKKFIIIQFRNNKKVGKI